MQTKGYGTLNGRVAHVVMWERAHGKVPDGLQLDHLCRNRACVNPEHLEPVTGAENVQRGLNTHLTPADIAAIREDPRLQREIAADFGVTQPTVSKIKLGATWRNV
jgi:hypothetical protein